MLSLKKLAAVGLLVSVMGVHVAISATADPVKGKAYYGMVEYSNNEGFLKAAAKKVVGLFTGTKEEKRVDSLKLEFRGTTLDRINPFRKPMYARIGSKGEDGKVIYTRGPIEYEISGDNLVTKIFEGALKKGASKTLTATITAPLSDVQDKGEINVSKGNGLVTETGTVLEFAQSISLKDQTKGLSEQLKNYLKGKRYNKKDGDQIKKDMSSVKNALKEINPF